MRPVRWQRSAPSLPEHNPALPAEPLLLSYWPAPAALSRPAPPPQRPVR
jgi:hypothetical protein